MFNRTIPGRLLQRTLRFVNSFSDNKPDWEKVDRDLRQLSKMNSVVIHEAGHAVANWMSPTIFTVLHVSAGDMLDFEGHCTSMRPHPICEAALWEELVCGIAGMVACRMVWPDEKPGGVTYDIEMFLNTAGRLSSNSEPPWLDESSSVMPDIVWGEELWRAQDEYSEIADLCYRRAMMLLANNRRGFIRICHVLNRRKKLFTPGITLALGIKSPVSTTAATIATIIDIFRECKHEER